MSFGKNVSFWWLLFLAVQNSSGDLVTHLLTDLGTFSFDIIEWPKRLVTFETFDLSDKETLFSDFQKI